MAVATLSIGAVLVFGLIGVALVLFVAEPVPTDTTAIAVIVSLVVLSPWTGISTADALSGFSSPATITIVAMFMLSAGIQTTGLVGVLGRSIARYTHGDERRTLAATIVVTGPVAGIINNTPVVAVFIPMITDLADANGLSPSKLLLPLSYAAMLGGTLTVIGTATNILAADLSRQLLSHPISMFEFTELGVLVLGVGSVYLMTIGRRLTPARIDPDTDLTREFEVDNYLAQVEVREDSPLVGLTVHGALDRTRRDFDPAPDLDILQLLRDGAVFVAPITDQTIEADDVITVRCSLQTLNRVAERYDLRQLHREEVTEADLEHPEGEGIPAEVVVPPESRFVGETVGEAKFPERYHTMVLAVRRGGETIRDDLLDRPLDAGDMLLLQTTPDALELLVESGDVVLTETVREYDGVAVDPRAALSPRTPVAVGIMVGVIAVAALGLLPIVIAALAGVVAMIGTRTLSPAEAYDAVSWNVVFLLAGVIPLGLAMQRTGGDAVLAGLLASSADVLPAIAVLALFYVVTGLLSNVITPVASVVLMIPVAVDTAARIGANEFAFLLAVTFAGSTAFMTPVGYQTNLMVYGPGGYHFTDYIRLGAPLQALLAVVTSLGIALFWGLG